MVPLGLCRALTLLFLPAIVASSPARDAGDPANPDWPCIQHKVPEISAGMVWAGPEVTENDKTWEESARLADLAHTISVRRMPIEEARAEIDRFAATLGEDKDEQLTLLFSGVLQTINAERTEIVAGIERYARRRAALADKIKAATAELNALRREAEKRAGQKQGGTG